MRDLLAEVLPADRVLDAAAEDLPVETSSLDLVTAGDAWHWFDGERVVPEMARVLRPGGELVLAWHAPFPGERKTWRAELQHLLSDLRGDHPYFTKDHGRRALDADERFTPLQNVRVAHHHEVDRGGLIDHVRSISYVADLDEERWDEVMAETRRIADEAPPRISMSYAIDLWITRRR
jgi:SAM-dependent methyltransferase